MCGWRGGCTCVGGGPGVNWHHDEEGGYSSWHAWLINVHNLDVQAIPTSIRNIYMSQLVPAGADWIYEASLLIIILMQQ